jgi:hypothetical protein
MILSSVGLLLGKICTNSPGNQLIDKHSQLVKAVSNLHVKLPFYPSCFTLMRYEEKLTGVDLNHIEEIQFHQ